MLAKNVEKNSQIEKVRNYYDSTVFDYWTLWTGKNNYSMHYGFYDDTVRNHDQAHDKMNEIVARFAHIKQGERFLDAGCGYGSSSIWLAKNLGCSGVGLTLVPFQAEKATEFAKKIGVGDRVRFVVKDYANTDFPNSTFDIYWGIESICHAESKEAVAKEAYRILKPGGRFVMSDYTLKENYSLDPRKKRLAEVWLKGWELPSIPSNNEYKKILEDAGFKRVEMHDITKGLEGNKFHYISRIATPIISTLYWTRIINKTRAMNLKAFVAHNAAMREGWAQSMVVVAYRE